MGSDSDDESSDGEADKSKKKSKKAKAPVKIAQIQKSSKKPKRKRQPQNRPFQRVKANAVSFMNDKLKDNTYNEAESLGERRQKHYLGSRGRTLQNRKTSTRRRRTSVEAESI